MGNDKAYVLTCSYPNAVPWNTIERSQRSMIAEPIRVGTMPSPDGTLKGGQAMRIYDSDGKAVPITTGNTKTGFYAVPVNTDGGGKAHTLKAQYYKNGIANFITNGGFGATGVAVPINSTEVGGCEKARTVMAGYQKYGVATMITNDGFKGGATGIALRVKEATKQGYVDIPRGGCVDLSMPNSKTRRGRSMETKSNCLQTSCDFYEYCGTLDQPIYQVKDGMITIKDKQYPIKLIDGCYIIRKLTVRECMRLQTVPEWYEFPVSNSQAYKMLGNGWTVDVISHLIKGALREQIEEDTYTQMDIMDFIGVSNE